MVIFAPCHFSPFTPLNYLAPIYNLTKMVMFIQKYQKREIYPIKNSPTDNRGEIDKIKQG